MMSTGFNMERSNLTAHGILGSILDGLPPQQASHRSEYQADVLHFVLGEESDYDLEIWLYREQNTYEGAGISAKLRGTELQGKYLWDMPFEPVDYESLDTLMLQVRQRVRTLLAYSTRIIQRKGLLLWHFNCQYHENDQWMEFYSAGCLRCSNVQVPYIAGKEKIYFGYPATPRGRTE
jgi:hypothetical protein